MLSINSGSLYQQAEKIAGKGCQVFVFEEQDGFTVPGIGDKLAAWEKEQQAYEEAISRYAQEHAAKIYAQVEVKGEVVATVYDNGVTCSSYDGMKVVGTDGSAGLDVAKTRLDEIARQINGKIRYSNFDQNAYGVGGIYATIPDSIPRPELNLHDILFNEFVEDHMRSKITAVAEKVG